MSLSDSDPIDVDSSEGLGGLFANLAPVQEEKPIAIKKKPGGFKFITKQSEKENKKNTKGLRGKDRDRSRSRSRDRGQPRRAEPQEQQQPDSKMIVISDDQEENNANLHNMSSFQYLNWRQRRKLDRMFQRQQRKYRQGKPKDQLSFKVFNTIEQYFR